MTYNTAELRQFIQQYLSADDLTALLYDHFIAVYENITPTMPKAQQVQLLLVYCDDHGRFPDLLAALQRLRPANFDPANFVRTAEPVETAVPAIPSADGVDSVTRQHPVTGKTMVWVPAGPFLFGDHPDTVELDGFWIDQTPVTNGDYARFVAATGHPMPRHWHGRSPAAAIADHPVVWVTWHDAAAYAAWAGLQLPTEQQWERAARGVDGRRYPWGDTWLPNRANTSETGQGGTTAVGHFSPLGDSPTGCADMAGNVWEWTASWYDESEQRRVVRGGCWYHNQRQATTTSRQRYDPTLAHDYYGFRLMTPTEPVP